MRHHVDLNGRRYTGFGRLNIISYDDVGHWCGAIRSDVLDSLGMVEMKGFTLCWNVVRLLLGISNGFFHYFLLPVFTEGF